MLQATRREFIGGILASGFLPPIKTLEMPQTNRMSPPVFLIGDVDPNRQKWKQSIDAAAFEFGWNNRIDVRFLSDCKRPEMWSSQSEYGAFRAAQIECDDANAYLVDLSGTIVARASGYPCSEAIAMWEHASGVSSWDRYSPKHLLDQSFFESEGVDKLIWSMHELAQEAIDLQLGFSERSPFPKVELGLKDRRYRALTVLLCERTQFNDVVANAVHDYPQHILIHASRRANSPEDAHLETAESLAARDILPTAHTAQLDSTDAIARFAVQTTFEISEFEASESLAGSARVNAALYEFVLRHS